MAPTSLHPQTCLALKTTVSTAPTELYGAPKKLWHPRNLQRLQHQWGRVTPDTIPAQIPALIPLQGMWRV